MLLNHFKTTRKIDIAQLSNSEQLELLRKLENSLGIQTPQVSRSYRPTMPVSTGPVPFSAPISGVSTRRGSEETEEESFGDERLAPQSIQDIEFEVQSAPDAVTAELTHEQSANQSQQNVKFLDENLGTKIIYNPISDSSIYDDSQPDMDLAKFLSRPVLIRTYRWLESDTPGAKSSFRPWYDYFNSTPIKKKLDNFAFLSCNLKLKFVVNASPFYYGAANFAYQPLTGYVDDLIKNDTTLGELVPYSQRPHLWIIPQRNQGGEITLPFFYHKNWLNASSALELQNMGKITYLIYQILQSANGVTGTGVTIQVFAWAEDVRLMGPTINLAVQSQVDKKKKIKEDEYGTGIISKPASAVAVAAGLLGEVPVIGPYMCATQYVASAVAQVAHLFGYTNVPNISNVDNFKPQPFPHLSSPEISTPVEKLTLDPKNELCIDPRTVGLPPIDELEILTLCQKESFLQSFYLATTDSVDDIKFTSLVTPFLATNEGGVTNPVIQHVPMAYVAALFQYWRGDIIFRFRFIATRFHKGRIRVSFDPSGNIFSTVPEYSTAFSQVLDIGHENDVEFRVPYSQATPWLNVNQQYANQNFSISSVTGPTHSATSDNGLLTVRVVTPLSAPILTSQVSVQIFVRAADNFEVALPVEPLPCSVFSIQSQDDVKFEIPDTVITGNAAGKQHPERFLVNMGEKITSLRTLLRRANFHSAYFCPANTAAFAARWRSLQSKYPYYYGYDNNGVNTANGIIAPANNYKFNFCKMTSYNWIAPMFVGQRGAMIWHYNFNTTASDLISDVQAIREASVRTIANYNSIVTLAAGATTSANSKFFVDNYSNCSSGFTLTNQNTQAGISASYPAYYKYRFQFTSPGNVVIGSSSDDSDTDSYSVLATLKPTIATKAIASLYVSRYVSIGTDFTFFMFLNVPSVYQFSSPVAT